MKLNTRKHFLTALIALSTTTPCLAAGDAKISWASALQGSAWEQARLVPPLGARPATRLAPRTTPFSAPLVLMGGHG
jgi:hypothetical protein